MKNKLVKVTWKDICGGKDWMSLKEAVRWGDKQYKAQYVSVGYLIHKTKDYILLAASYDSDDEQGFNDVSMIMRRIITRIEKL